MHLGTEVALDLLEGLVEDDERVFWEEHLHGCVDCSRQLDYWRTMKPLLKQSHLESAPDEDLADAIGVFVVRRHAAQSVVRTFASILFDSFAQPAMAGARGVAVGTRQVVLRAEEFDIHVKIWGESDHKQLLGQLLPRHSSSFVQSARLHLLRNGERFETTATDEMGEFRFTDIPDGLLSLQIDLPHLTVIGALNVTEVL